MTALSQVGREDIRSVGGKAANLGELLRHGFVVPDGFVVTTGAYDAYVDAHGLRGRIGELARERRDADIRALFDAPPAPKIAHEIDAGLARLDPDVAVAVRSSATAEDLEGASFAGQQDTYLNVRGYDAVLDAVRRCWASLWTARALDYRARHGVDPGQVSLAVVVQRLVPADAAGVMFTANPANGQRAETVIDAAFGLGEAVVGGEVSPDALVVRDGRVISRETGDKRVMTVLADAGTRGGRVPEIRRRAPVLADAQAVELAGIGTAVQEVFGAPQDIEWVLADGRFSLVQSRPVTALPDPTGPVPTDWSVPDPRGIYVRASIIEQMPDPLSPLFADLITPIVGRSVRLVLRRYFGHDLLRPDDVGFPVVNGYPYYFYSTPGLLRLLALTPMAVPMLVGTGRQNGLTYWRETARPAYAEFVARQSGREARALPAGELLKEATDLLTAGATYYTAVQAVIPVAATTEILFTACYDRWCRRSGDPAATTYLLGLDSQPMRAERSLYDLAQWCRDVPEVAEALGAGQEVPEAYRDAFERRLSEHLAAHGHVTYNLDVASPVPADDPAPVLATLRFYLDDAGLDPTQRQARLARERREAQEALLGRLDPVRRRLVAALLAKAQEAAPLREDALADIGLGWPAARRFLRELGRRLTEVGAVGAADDVFWLTLEEARAAAGRLDAGEPITSHAEAVASRREVWRGQRRATPPSWLPDGFWKRVFARWMPSLDEQGDGPTLRGLGASGGRAEGPARVLLGPENFASMRPGDVLVAPITTPAYTPFFAMASAVVTDIGGPLSHSSIVAREYAIPAVLGTGSATTRIVDGQRVVVDGDRGVVMLDDSELARTGNDRASERPRADAHGRPDPGRVVRSRAVTGAAAVVAVAVLVGLRRAVRCRRTKNHKG